MLRRGYQLDVLSFTVHATLLAIKKDITPGSIDHVVEPLMEVLMPELTIDEVRATHCQ